MARPSLVLTQMLLVLVALTSARTFAAEVAYGDEGAPAQVAANRGTVDQSAAARLIRGDLPTLSRIDAKYQSPRTKDICRQTWREFRAMPVRPVAVRPSLTVLRANAQKAGLSLRKFQRAYDMFLKNQNQLPNQSYLTVVDFDKRSTEKRMFTVDLRSGVVEGFHTTAGENSDPRGTGYATNFGNVDGSLASSLGCYVASGEYKSRTKRRRPSLVLHGLERTNDNACDRHIVIHAAKYAGDVPGRSDGCLAVRPEVRQKIFDRVGDGGLICAYREGKITPVRVAKRPARHRRHRYARTRSSQPVAQRSHDLF